VTEKPIYHRTQSDSQTVEDAKNQIASQEIWGGPARNCHFSDIPKVKAYTKVLPLQEDRFSRGEATPTTKKLGIEFTTEVEPDRGTRPGLAYWSGDREGVRNEDDYAKIRVAITFCNQLEEVWVASE
jgi:hypothetical protein